MVSEQWLPFQLLFSFSFIIDSGMKRSKDNVGSNQLQNIRKGLRSDSIMLMGKNTMMKRSVRIYAEKTLELILKLTLEWRSEDNSDFRSSADMSVIGNFVQNLNSTQFQQLMSIPAAPEFF